MSLFGLQSINKLGLQANKRALLVTGNNIANVNTPGYSRRVAIFSSLSLGGVRILSVNRIHDQFMDIKLRDSNSRFGARLVRTENLQLLENILNDSDESGITPAIRDFFASLQDLSLQPAGTTEREVVRSRSNLLITSLQSAIGDIKQNRRQIDQQIRAQIGNANQILESIAELNRAILESGDGQDINQVLDQRDSMIEKLSLLIPINVIGAENEAVTIFAKGGITLVEGKRAFKLVATSDPANEGFARIGIQMSAGNIIPIEGKLGEGTLGALLEVRDGDALDILNRIQRMAAQMILSFNQQHRLGTGLDGIDQRDFFDGLGVSTRGDFANFGGGTITASSISDEANLTLDDYEIRFTAPGVYDIVDVTTGQTLSSDNVYVKGAAITFAGMSVTLDDDGTPPAAGDVFHVNAYAGSIERMQLSAAITNNVQAIAAGMTSSPGDNENILALAALRDAMLMEGNTQNFDQFYSATRVQLGISVESSKSRLADEEISQFQIRELANSVRAVSIDEEAINLIQFQRAFQASSKMISATDELLQTLLNMI